MSVKDELLRAEEERFVELWDLVRRLSPDQAAERGYTEEWSVKDMAAHIAAWCAEAATRLEQMRMGTYTLTREDIAALYRDVDAINRRFYEACRDLTVTEVRGELSAARTRMLQEFGAMEDPDRKAARWFRETGPEHYDEHLPRLREWVAELRGQGSGD